MMDSLIKISKATGVTIRWLKDGKGPKFGPPLFEESKKSARGLTDKRRAEFAASHWADMDKVPKKDRDAVMAMIVDMQSDPKLRSVLVEHYQFMSQKKKRKRK